ncbi:thioredoxin [Sulfuriroseicoccus oceanibius]|uniref:Thioredoxin n=1 Tax=Sulfuriroseicoccus oceanibius TaxID=2707525 RepID=A0A6B3L7L9_9BACT|nr:thioredoxin [Sulfuriroseicoccus oceanibius]QQL45368.1 thioredoxin [Sulfuriroseicoccus oceanibius]
MSNEHTITGTEANFASEVVESDVPVLVDFWAEWCGPCKMISPVLDQIATDVAGKAKVVKVNVDENRALAGQFNVTSIPMMLFFKDGEVKDTVVGAGTPKDALQQKLEALA